MHSGVDSTNEQATPRPNSIPEAVSLAKAIETYCGVELDDDEIGVEILM